MPACDANIRVPGADLALLWPMRAIPEQACRMTAGEPRAAARWSRLLRAAERLALWGSRLSRRDHFRDGVDRSACRAIHRAAARGTLYSFAPPPPLTLVAQGRGRWVADEYRFRSPFVSHIAERNQAYLRYYQCGARDCPLLIVNPGTETVTAMVECHLIARLLGAGIDIALPDAPGGRRRRGPADHRRGWAATVGAALSAIVQLVHDNVAIECWARTSGYRIVGVTGLEIGGTVAALLAATTARFDAAIPVLAGAHPGLLWLPPRTLAVGVNRRTLARGGVRHARTLVRLFNPVAPVRLPRPRLRERCTLVGLRFDNLVPGADVQDLATHWRVAPVWLPRRHAELPQCAGELAAIIARATLRPAASNAQESPYT
jgi:hypothetical protein